MDNDRLVSFHAKKSYKVGDDIYTTETVIVLPPGCPVEDIVQAVTTALSIEHHYIYTSSFETDKANSANGNGNGRIKNPEAEMTPAQYRFLRGLGKRLGLETEEEVADYVGAEALDNAQGERIFRLTRGKASEAIEAMQVAIQVQEEADAAAAGLQSPLPEDPLVKAAVEQYGAQVRIVDQLASERQRVIDMAHESFGYDPDKARERAVAFVQKNGRPNATWDDLTREELQAVVEAMTRVVAQARKVK